MRRGELINNNNKGMMLLIVIALITAHVYINQPSQKEIEKEISEEELLISDQVSKISNVCKVQQLQATGGGRALYTVENRPECRKSAEKLIDYLETTSESQSLVLKSLGTGIDKILGLLPMGFLLL